MNSSTAARIAAISGFLAVALGAFGAHALRAKLDAHGMLPVWQTAALYHLVHSVVLLVLAHRPVVARLPFLLFGIGIVLFSGSLYALAATHLNALGMITPIGGLCLLGGWVAVASKAS